KRILQLLTKAGASIPLQDLTTLLSDADLQGPALEYLRLKGTQEHLGLLENNSSEGAIRAKFHILARTNPPAALDLLLQSESLKVRIPSEVAAYGTEIEDARLYAA